MHKTLKALIVSLLILIISAFLGCTRVEEPEINHSSGNPSSTPIGKDKLPPPEIRKTAFVIRPETANTQTAENRIPTISIGTTAPTTNTISLLLHSLKQEIGGLMLSEDGRIQKQLNTQYTNLAFSETPCILIGTVPSMANSGSIVIEKVNINQDVIESKIIPVAPKYFSPTMFGFSLSPDENWLSYILPEDDNNYNPRFSTNKIIVLMNVQEQNKTPIILANMGGVPLGGAVWTKDSKFLIYTEIDTFGIPQIYSFNVITQEKIKLSSLDTQYKDLEFDQITLSPDGKYIGFIGSTEQHVGYVGAIQVDSLLLKWMELPANNYVPGTQLFWNADSSQLLTRIDADLNNNTNDEFITWFDVNSGKISRSFPEMGEKSYTISMIFPLSRDLSRVGFYGAEIKDINNQGSYFIYDANSKMINTIELPELCCLPYEFIVPKVVLDPTICK